MAVGVDPADALAPQLARRRTASRASAGSGGRRGCRRGRRPARCSARSRRRRGSSSRRPPARSRRAGQPRTRGRPRRRSSRQHPLPGRVDGGLAGEVHERVGALAGRGERLEVGDVERPGPRVVDRVAVDGDDLVRGRRGPSSRTDPRWPAAPVRTMRTAAKPTVRGSSTRLLPGCGASTSTSRAPSAGSPATTTGCCAPRRRWRWTGAGSSSTSWTRRGSTRPWRAGRCSA